MTEPVDTVRVLGGRPLGTVDADAVRVAAARTRDAELRLRNGAFRAVRAADGLARVWSAPVVHRHPRAAWLSLTEEVRAASRRLGSTADECALLRDRLVRAAGLYEHGESLTHDMVGRALGAPAALGALAVMVLPDSSLSRALRAAVAPWTDEAVVVLGHTLSSPLAALQDDMTTVAGAALGLSVLLRAGLPTTALRVSEVRPAHVDQGWDEPTGTIDGALARIPHLTGAAAGPPAPRMPAGTLAVQRVEHGGGPVTWTVLIPGTQEFVSTTQPFDGLSDLDLMAHRPADLSVAIQEALAQAGAGPREEVVLVGHSLGGIVAMQLASSPGFRARHRVGGVVTAGSPTASFAVPPGIPVLHLENEEELVPHLDGRSGLENPGGPDRVTVTRSLAASSSADPRAAGTMGAAHGIRTHRRTLALAQESRSAQVQDVVTRIEARLGGDAVTTRFYSARRVLPPPATTPEVSGASSGRAPR